MTIDFSDFPTLLIMAFLTLLVALPVKVSANAIGAGNPTIIRSFMAMFLPVVVTILLSNISSAAILLYPLALIFSVMFILHVGYLGAIGITILSVVIYYIVITQFFGGISIS